MHWHRLLLIVLTAFTLASAPVAAHPALARPQLSPLLQSSAEELLARGLARAAAGDFDAAIADLTEAARINPKLLEAWVARADFKHAIALYLDDDNRLGEREAREDLAALDAR